MENKLDKLIVVESLPVIREQLETLSKEIDKDIKKALALECTEDSKVQVKAVRANLNNIKNTLEEKRKSVKNAIMNPYLKFEEIYKELITDKLNAADFELKEKIDVIENQQRKDKEDELRRFFGEYKESNRLDFISFEDVNLNITLSASEKSLKDQIIMFINKINDDMALIDTQQDKDEIFIEYQKDLNISRAITIVAERKKKLEEIRIAKEEQERLRQQEETIVNTVEEIIAPVEIGGQTEVVGNAINVEPESITEYSDADEERYEITFTVVNVTLRQRDLIKEFLERERIEWKNE